MKVIIFIGHHKVGSTSLQSFLAQNSISLLRAGILYPSIDPQGMSAMLRKAIRGHDKIEDLPINALEPHNALAFTMLSEATGGDVPKFHKGLSGSEQMLLTIQRQVDSLKPHTVILAAEVFSNFAPVSLDLIRQLTSTFAGAEIHIVATLRRVDQYLASWHAQRLRFDHKLKPLSAGGTEEYFNNIHFDYRKLLEGWKTVLPDAKFTIRNYAEVLQCGGSVNDFIVQSGVNFPEGLLNVPNSNSSIHRAFIEILRQGNHVLNKADSNALRNLLDSSELLLSLPKSRKIELFGAKTRENLLAEFVPIHNYISELTGKDKFFPFVEEIETVLPIPENEVAKSTLDQILKLNLEYDNDNVKDFISNLKL